VQSGSLRYVPTPDDYSGLGISPSNTISLSANSVSSIPTGADVLRDGAAYTVLGGNGLYLVNNNTSLYVPSVAMASDYGVNWGQVRFNLNPNVLNSAYPLAGSLTRWAKSGGGGLAYISDQYIVSVGSAAASAWGINTTTQTATTLDPATLYHMTGSLPLGQFVRNTATGGVYYGTGGAAHYIASYNAFVNLGGTTANIINVSPDFFTSIPSGYTYNN
jgi:hypothetical protein